MYLSESRQVSSQVHPPTTTAPPLKKSPRRKKVVQKETPEKKPISPKLRKVRPKTTTSDKSAKLRLQDEEDVDGSSKGLERQTVKRTVSIKAHVDGDGVEPMDGERVVRYEHHVSHRL